MHQVGWVVYIVQSERMSQLMRVGVRCRTGPRLDRIDHTESLPMVRYPNKVPIVEDQIHVDAVGHLRSVVPRIEVSDLLASARNRVPAERFFHHLVPRPFAQEAIVGIKSQYRTTAQNIEIVPVDQLDLGQRARAYRVRRCDLLRRACWQMDKIDTDAFFLFLFLRHT